MWTSSSTYLLAISQYLTTGISCEQTGLRIMLGWRVEGICDLCDRLPPRYTVELSSFVVTCIRPLLWHTDRWNPKTWRTLTPRKCCVTVLPSPNNSPWASSGERPAIEGNYKQFAWSLQLSELKMSGDYNALSRQTPKSGCPEESDDPAAKISIAQVVSEYTSL
jgi:hypothetical protein